jgi:hypothetical protein
MKLIARPPTAKAKSADFEHRLLQHERKLQALIGNKTSFIDHLLHKLVVPVRKT